MSNIVLPNNIYVIQVDLRIRKYIQIYLIPYLPERSDKKNCRNLKDTETTPKVLFSDYPRWRPTWELLVRN